MSQWFIYIVECSDGTYYCGITNDIDKRMRKHNTGRGAKYTRSRLPVFLLYSEQVETKSLALKREYEIKRMKRKQKESLVNGSDTIS